MSAILAPSGRSARFELAVSSRLMRARYEGATYTPKRGWVPEQIDDTAGWDLSLNSYSLHELSRISIYLYKNDPIIRGVINRFIVDTIGCGIIGIPASTSKEWAKRGKLYLRAALKYPQVNTRDNQGRTQRKILLHTLLEGNLYGILVGDPLGIQLVRQHRLQEIRRDRYGRPASYVFSVRRGGEVKPVRYDASEVIHFQNAVFADAPLGEPILAPALNTARDMGEILVFEKDAVKDASSHKGIIKTASGELDPVNLIKSGGDTLNGSDGEDPAVYYRQKIEGEHLVLMRGDDWTAYEPKRPGPAWQGFMDFLSGSICLSLGYPPAVALGNKMGGVDSRRDLATAQRTIEPVQEDIACDWRRFLVHLMAPATEEGGPLSSGLPDDWREFRWQFPKPKTADYGREAREDREDVREGLMTREEYWARQYQDPDEQEQRIVDEADERRERLKAKEMTVVEFRGLVDLHSSTPDTAPPVASDSDGADKDEAVSSSEDVQKLALNGAQLTAVQEFVQQVANKQLPAEAVKLALYIALPLADRSEIDRMVDAAAAFTPEIKEEPKPQPEDATP